MLECCASSTDTDELLATGHGCEMERPKRDDRDQSVKVEKGEKKVSIL
jgi:hypothetical protein